MVRTQIQLTEEQTARVKRIARRRGVSMATVVREAIDRLDDVSDAQHERAWSRFRSAVGSFHGGTGDVSEHHDDVLVSAYAE